MLTELRVKNYALIKDLVFKPGQSFNVITGETGAGKSILLGAMGLLLGERTDSVAVQQNEEKCVIEGYFNIKGYDLQSWFEQNEFDFTNELIIRREILVNGKSRAFINDTPAQLSQLKEVGKYLIDIHSQHDNLDLFQKSFQFRVLDSFAGIGNEQTCYLKLFEELKTLTRRLANLEEAEKKGAGERDYKQFLYEELLAANLVPDEGKLLEEEMLALSHADTHLQTLDSINDQLSESETALIEQLASIRIKINQIVKNDKRFEELSDRINESYYNFKDISTEIDKLAQATHSDPERMEAVNQRLTLLHALSKKHRDEDLIGKRDQLKKDLETHFNLDNEIQIAKTEKENTEEKCKELALRISAQRKEHAGLLQNQINNNIIQLGMPGSQIIVEVTDRPDSSLGIYGMDDINMLYSPAEGKKFNPIQNIASGGEISRVMLVLKSILARKNVMPTIIFDEIDSGVSGEIAFKMGEMLNSMAENMQLIVITHLPQIAAKGNKHYFVYKNFVNRITSSNIKELNEDERITEIAEMIGGKAYGEAILESAKQLLTL